MIEIIDYGCGNWSDWTFKNKKELKDFLQAMSCDASEYSEDEYYNENVDVDLDEYCDMYQIEYVIKEEA